jgi:hypothetical protein
MDPARLQRVWQTLVHGSQLLTYIRLPFCGLIDHRREPRWIFARFHLNAAKALAEAVPVQTPGSGSDGVTVSPSSANRCNCQVRPIDPFLRISFQAAQTERLAS